MGMVPTERAFSQSDIDDDSEIIQSGRGTQDPAEAAANEEAVKEWEASNVQSATVQEQAESLQQLSCSNGPNDLGGTIWRDYNSDGIKSSREPGFNQVTISAYDINGLVATTTANSSGIYNFPSIFSGRSGDEAHIRLEFTDLPSGISPAVHGTDSGSIVQVHSSPTCYANVGVQNPADYCQENPDVAISCFVMGEYDGPNKNLEAVVAFPYDATGNRMNDTSKLTAWDDIGAVYGAAWNAKTEHLYFSSYHKRYVGFGPNGPDAIYQLNRNGNVLGAIELDALLSGTNTAGTNRHNLTSVGANGEINDDNAYAYVGRTAFGDLEMADDMETLYVVNLHDRKIYAFNVADGNVNNATLLNTPGAGGNNYGWATPDECGSVAHRPFGLAWHEGKLWVGSVCESNGSGGPGNAYVHSLDPSGTTFNLETMLSLNFDREDVFQSGSDDWNAWSNNVTTVNARRNTSGDTSYPQPMLTDIEFDPADGAMILGFRDRWGDQTGNDIPLHSGSSRKIWGNAGGDILRVCNTNSGWVVEGSSACPTNGSNKNSGPGGSQYAEYYNWDFQNLAQFTHSSPTSVNFHSEIVQGGLVQVPNRSTVMATVMNPYSDYSGGIVRFENAHGRRESVSGPPSGDYKLLSSLGGGYTLYDSGGFFNGPPRIDDTFGKANGLGDLEAMCDLAPLEIGNYIWQDLDEDGIQDPNEPPLENMEVALYSDSGNVIATATSNANGNVYFVDSSDPRLQSGGIWRNGTPSHVGVATSNGGLTPNTNYQLRINLSQTTVGTATPSPLTQTYLEDGYDYLRDSDGNPALNPGFVTAPISMGEAGDNDNSISFGFIQFNGKAQGKAWDDLSSDGLRDEGEPGTRGVTVNVLNNNGVVVGTAETDLSGDYTIDNLPPGTYQVEFNQPPFLAFSPQDVGNDDTIDSDPDTVFGRTESFTLNSQTPSVTYDAGLTRQQAVNYAPQIPNPGDQQNAVGESVYLILIGIDAIEDVLVFESTNLPTGLSINAETGTITGNPVVPGRYDVTITVHDDKGVSGSAAFVWTITALPEPICNGLVREAEDATLTGFAKKVMPDGASQDQHILVPEQTINQWNGPNDLYKADFCYTVDTAGIYRILGTAHAPNGASDSFYVSVNGAPEDGYLWDVNATDYITDFVSHRDVADPVEVTLPNGQHEVSVYLREDGTQLDKLELVLVQALPELQVPDNCGDLIQEAEDGLLYGGFVKANNSGASGGQYVYVPHGYGTNYSGSLTDDRAEYCFTVPEAGTYVLKGTVGTTHSLHNSFYVTAEATPGLTYLWDTDVRSNWYVDELNNRDIADPVLLDLTADQHLITIFLREDGSRLDKLELAKVDSTNAVSAADYSEASEQGESRFAGESNIIGTLTVTPTYRIEPSLAGITVTLSNNEGVQASSATNHIGRYYMDNVIPGDYTLTIDVTDETNESGKLERSITVEPSQTDASAIELSNVFEPVIDVDNILYLPMLVK